MDRQKSTPAEQLHSTGFGIVTLADDLWAEIQETLSEAVDFFALPESVKRGSFNPGMHWGYRFAGIEYSQTPDRPDLNESVSYRALHEMNGAGSIDHSAARLLTSMATLARQFDHLAQDVLRKLSERYTESAEAIATSLDSWLQINYYRPAQAEREFLQEKHEDGHLITFVLATAKGLEIFPSNAADPVPVTTGPKQAIVMPGDLLSLLTDGDIPPLYHQVRAHRDVTERLSLMYFVNPDSSQDIYPWKVSDHNKGINIAQRAAANPQQHGLSPLDHEHPR